MHIQVVMASVAINGDAHEIMQKYKRINSWASPSQPYSLLKTVSQIERNVPLASTPNHHMQSLTPWISWIYALPAFSSAFRMFP